MAQTSLTPLDCPPGMGGLQQCYDDLNNASAFIAQLMIDQINNNPAVMEAFIQQLNRTGNAVPALGVLNGTPATAPQVGEYIQLSGEILYTATTAQAFLTLGTLPPGDWNCWLWATFSSVVQGASFILQPLPPGFAANPSCALVYGATPPNYAMFSMQVEALTAADSLIVANCQVAGSSGTSGVFTVYFAARRMR